MLTATDDDLFAFISGWGRRGRFATSEEPLFPLSCNWTRAASAIRRKTALAFTNGDFLSLHTAHATGRWRGRTSLFMAKGEFLLGDLGSCSLGLGRGSTVASTSAEDDVWGTTSRYFWLSFPLLFSSADQDVRLFNLSSVSWSWWS